MFFAKYIQKIDLISKFIGSGATTTTDAVLLPAIVTSTTAEYLRVGNDLVIKIPGDSLVLHDYFVHPVVLKTELGETLPVAKIIAMVNEHPQPVLVAAKDNVALQTALEKIGKITATVEGPVTAQDPANNTRTLNKGDSVYLHDTIVTVARSYVKIALNDGTVLQLGPLSRCSLDKYSYDPSGKAGGTFEASVFTGFFRYISGKISGNTGEQHTVITTPSANIGIRGSEIDAQVDQNGSTTVLHLAGLVSVSSRYRPGEEIVVYERGTTIYIPNDRASATTSTATENQIQEKDQEWQIFNIVSPMGEVVMESETVVGNLSPTVEKVVPPTEAPREGPGPESHAPGPMPPDHHPDRLLHGDERPHHAPHHAPPDHPAGPPPLEFRLEPGPMKLGEPRNHNEDEGPKPPVGERPNELGNPPDNLHGMLPHEEDNHPLPPLPPPSESETPLPPPPLPPREPDNQVIAITLKEDEATLVPVSGPLNQLTQPEHGNVVDNGNGTLTYTPITDYHGQDSFIVTLNDHQTITVSLTITEKNDPLVAIDTKATTLEDENLILFQTDFLQANVADADKDDEDDKLTIVSVEPIFVRDDRGNLVNDLTHGQVFLDEKGNMVYSPAPNFNGEAQFTYTVQDSEGARDTAQVFVNVVPVNDVPTADPDYFTFDTKTPWSISANSLVANDKDVENDHLTVVKVLNPEEGTVILDKGEITFTPGPNFTQGGFDYVVNDGEKTDTGQVTITLHEKPSLPPIARDETVSTTKAHDSLTITANQLLANDSDPENDPLTIIAVKDGNNGSVRLDNSGNVVFTPESEFVNQKVGNFTYQISDGHGNLTSATAVVTLNNMPPKATDDSITTNNVAPVTITTSQLLVNDQDPENNALRIDALHNGNNGSVAFDRQGNIVFTPNSEFVKQGVGNFTYQINDDNGNTTTATVTVSLTNRPPLAGPDLVTTDHTRPLTITAGQLLTNDSDPDGDPLKISNVSHGNNGSVNLDSQGNIIFTGDANFSLQREGNFTYDLTDGQGHTATATVTVSLTNHLPQANPDSVTTDNTRPLPITANQLLTNDRDPDGDPLKMSNVSNGQNGTVTLDNQGNMVFTPDVAFAKQKTGDFSYQVSDGHGNSNTATVTIKLERAPVDAKDDSVSPTHHNTPITITARELLANDSGPAGEPLKISNVSDSQHGTVKLDNQGNIVFTPDGDFVKQGGGQFTYEVTDGQGSSDTAVVTVPFENKPPIATPDTVTTHDLTKVTITANQLLANDRDPDGDQLTISNVSAGQNGSIKLGGDGNLIFSPDQNFVKDGKGSFTYDLSDGYNHTTATTVTVTLTNKTPLAKDDGPFDLGYESSKVISKADLLKNDSDSDSDPLTLTLVPNSGVNGTAVLNKDGDVVFTRDLATPPAVSGPSTRAGAAEFKGSFDYEIDDGHGGKAQAHVVVTGKDNQPPVANHDDQAKTSKNKPVDISLTYSDPDPNDTVTIGQISKPLHGSLSSPDKQGQVTYTPADNFTGKDSFTYTVKDSHGATDTATVNVTVTNTPPQAIVDDPLSTTTNTSLSLPASQLSSNDTDADPGDQETLQVIKVDNAANGTVNLTNGEITFTPSTGFEGETNFSYTITDRSGDQASALVTVTVTKGLQAIDDTLLPTVTNTAVTTPAEELLANDIKAQPNDTLIISAVSNSQHGTVVQDSKGNITFTPDPDFTGPASFDYTATDNRGQSDQATVTVVVKAELPEAKDDNVTTTVNTPLTLPTPKGDDLLANDTGESITIFDVTNATHGQVKLNGTRVEFTPERDFTGDASFDYTIQDSYADKATATVTVAVKPINLPPLVTLPGQSTPLIYKVGDAAQLIDSNATVSDSDSPDFDTGKLQVAITANRTRGDLLEIQNTGAISVSNPSSGLVSFNGTTIGNFTTLFTTGALLISLNAQATPETTTALLQAITYRNTVTDPSSETRTVSITLSDGDGATSAVVRRDIELNTSSPPKAEPDQFDRPFNAHATLSVTDLLANDTNPNPDALSLTQLTQPSPGVEVKLVGDEIQLFIDGLVSRNFDSASFDYTISNGQGTEDTATVTITPTNVITGTPNADQLAATADQNIVMGNGGDDTFALSNVPSILLGGDGNDLFLFDPATDVGVYIDGGTGTDTLSLNGASNKVIDLPRNDDSPADQKFELHGIDIIDLTGRGNQLRLNLKDVLDMTDSGKLEIHGDSTSMVTSAGQGWINQGIDSSGLYRHYTAPSGTAELLVSTEMAFQLVT